MNRERRDAERRERQRMREERAKHRQQRQERLARKRTPPPPNPDPRIQAIYDRRVPYEGRRAKIKHEPEFNGAAVTDVVREGDPLYVCNHLFEPANLRDAWKHGAGFLVLGGPSLKTVDYMRLAERGVVSMGVNNVAAYAPVTAFTCSDPPVKFHHGIWLDQKLIKFVPVPKLKHGIRVKQSDGRFTGPRLGERLILVKDCPNVYGYSRHCEWRPEQFLTANSATWGNNNKGVIATGREKLLFTMFLGLRLCYYLGLRRCYLLGCDFTMSAEYGYAFGQGRDAGAARSNNNSYRQADKWLHEIRPVLEDAGMQVYNCNPASHCSAFDHVPFEEAIADCKRLIGREPFDLSGWYEK